MPSSPDRLQRDGSLWECTDQWLNGRSPELGKLGVGGADGMRGRLDLDGAVTADGADEFPVSV